MRKLLFVCTGNINRSKTAEFIFKKSYETKSAGIYAGNTAGTKKISEELVNWADVVMVFEQEHINAVKDYPSAKNKSILNLEIPDVFVYMSPRLCDLLNKKVRMALRDLLQQNNLMVGNDGSTKNGQCVQGSI